ncbi:MAG: hypothetical protein ACI9TH_003372 [Kiritimatiellia bacterium]|jgi:hypothetical protein
MKVVHAARKKGRTPDPRIVEVLQQVSETRLESVVQALDYPRHYTHEKAGNLQARDWITTSLREMGYTVEWQGSFDNIVALPPDPVDGPLYLLGAHYDTVPKCPGADDNSSAVAAAMEAGRVLRERGVPCVVVIFNREEDGLLGSIEYVASLATETRYAIAAAHIFEMVGYASDQPGSQRLPPGLPIEAPDVGDFLALLSNRTSNKLNEELLQLARTYLPAFKVLGLKTYLGMEKLVPVLLRSDHAPFWDARIPAIMWTDTSEFRNAHYHTVSDTPDTLDYGFMAKVTRLVVSHVLACQS